MDLFCLRRVFVLPCYTQTANRLLRGLFITVMMVKTFCNDVNQGRYRFSIHSLAVFLEPSEPCIEDDIGFSVKIREQNGQVLR